MLSDDIVDAMRSDLDYRHSYAESFADSMLAAQIKVIREQRGMRQEDLATAIGTKQSGVARLENVNYSSWRIATLHKIARAFGLRLRITFESFGTLGPDLDNFNRAGMERVKFEEDPAFSNAPETKLEKVIVAADPAAEINVMQAYHAAMAPMLAPGMLGGYSSLTTFVTVAANLAPLHFTNGIENAFLSPGGIQPHGNYRGYLLNEPLKPKPAALKSAA